MFETFRNSRLTQTHKNTTTMLRFHTFLLLLLHLSSFSSLSTEIPTFNSLLPHSQLISGNTEKPVIISRSTIHVQQIWNQRTNMELRGAAPTNLDDRDIWDNQLDFLLTNYITLVESFLHTYLRTKNVQTELILGHTGFHYEKARGLASIYADPRVETVCEIGFNAGHSSLNALLAREGIQVISFDLGEYWDKYSQYSYELLQTSFPGQLTLVLGDSTETVPKFVSENPDYKCNILFIDGGHTHEVAEADILNMAPMANDPFHRVIVDDADWGDVRRAWDEAVQDTLVQEIGWIKSNYCLEYEMEYIEDTSLMMNIPVLTPAENSGPLNPEVLGSTGAIVVGTYV